MTLSQNGKAHFALRYLAGHGPSTIAEIQKAHVSHRGKISWLVRAMSRLGWVRSCGDAYTITSAGLDAYEHLSRADLDTSEASPNARVFGRAA